MKSLTPALFITALSVSQFAWAGAVPILRELKGCQDYAKVPAVVSAENKARQSKSNFDRALGNVRALQTSCAGIATRGQYNDPTMLRKLTSDIDAAANTSVEAVRAGDIAIKELEALDKNFSAFGVTRQCKEIINITNKNLAKQKTELETKMTEVKNCVKQSESAAGNSSASEYKPYCFLLPDNEARPGVNCIIKGSGRGVDEEEETDRGGLF